MKEFPIDTRIPTMYFKRTNETMSNIKNYLPLELQINMTTLKEKGFHNTHTANERPQRRAKSKQQKKMGIALMKQMQK
jgi:sister-chromatid-cohesion protein PDS5